MGGSSSIAIETRDLLEYKPGNGENGSSTHDKDTLEAPSMTMTNVSRKSFENDLVVRPNMNMGMSIITDENGYIVCSSQKSSVLEYKPIDNGDDGWYIVSISLRDGFKVVVKYERLAEEREEEIELGKLRSAEDLYVKFRVPSTQVKDEDCWKATPSMLVMVSYLLPADHGSTLYRYYDAWIEKVRLHSVFGLYILFWHIYWHIFKHNFSFSFGLFLFFKTTH